LDTAIFDWKGQELKMAAADRGSIETDPGRVRVPILGTGIDVIAFDEALERLTFWAGHGQSRVVCVCNAHSVVTATEDSAFKRALDSSDLATADGAPVAWLMRRLGYSSQRRVSGPDLMLAYCEKACGTPQSVFLLGGTSATLAGLQDELLRRFPELKIAGAYSPPFRTLTSEEDERLVEMINLSGASTVWVGLGCPKQELWMAAHRGRVHSVMIGVGAAFEFFGGSRRRAPRWMQASGLEWLHRLVNEPRRLWRRYLVTNTAFIVGAARQLLGQSSPSPH